MRSLFNIRRTASSLPQEPVHSEVPALRGADMAALYYGQRMGGDLYDFIRVSPSRVVFGLLDVAGRHEENVGIVKAAQEVFRSAAPELLSGADINEANGMVELSLELNRAVLQAANGVRCCPAFVGCYNEALGTVCYSNAGHTPALLRDRFGVTPLGATGLPLGLFSHATHDAPTCALESGAAMLLVSRGVVEGRCNGQEFGMERATQLFQGTSFQDAKELCAAVVGSVKEFMCTPPTHNDVTVLALVRSASS